MNKFTNWQDFPQGLTTISKGNAVIGLDRADSMGMVRKTGAAMNDSHGHYSAGGLVLLRLQLTFDKSSDSDVDPSRFGIASSEQTTKE